MVIYEAIVHKLDYDMRWYPFDTQRCTMQMVLYEETITLYLYLVITHEEGSKQE
jgi:hypothetical protein